MAREKIRIKLRGYDHELVDSSIRKIVDSAKQTRAKTAGPVPLPTKRRIYTVLRSPHVNKKSKFIRGYLISRNQLRKRSML